MAQNISKLEVDFRAMVLAEWYVRPGQCWEGIVSFARTFDCIFSRLDKSQHWHSYSIFILFKKL